jgi:hypothetical protein
MALLQKAYLGATPLFRDVPWFYETPLTIQATTTSATSVTASASAHTKGAWSQLIASTSAETTILTLNVANNASATDTAALLDIGVGAAGSETVIVPDIAVGAASNIAIQVPVKIPSGSRIAARAQSVVGSRAITVGTGVNAATIASDAALIPTSVDTLGIDTATSTGTVMSGASGTWVEIVASTTKDYTAFCLVPSSSDSDIASLTITYDIGVGAAGSEVAFGQLQFGTINNEIVTGRTAQIVLFGKEVPSGSRIAVRHNIATNPGKYDACVIAVPKV